MSLVRPFEKGAGPFRLAAWQQALADRNRAFWTLHPGELWFDYRFAILPFPLARIAAKLRLWRFASMKGGHSPGPVRFDQ